MRHNCHLCVSELKNRNGLVEEYKRLFPLSQKQESIWKHFIKGQSRMRWIGSGLGDLHRDAGGLANRNQIAQCQCWHRFYALWEAQEPMKQPFKKKNWKQLPSFWFMLGLLWDSNMAAVIVSETHIWWTKQMRSLGLKTECRPLLFCLFCFCLREMWDVGVKKRWLLLTGQHMFGGW